MAGFASDESKRQQEELLARLGSMVDGNAPAPAGATGAAALDHQPSGEGRGHDRAMPAPGQTPRKGPDYAHQPSDGRQSQDDGYTRTRTMRVRAGKTVQISRRLVDAVEAMKGNLISANKIMTALMEHKILEAYRLHQEQGRTATLEWIAGLIEDNDRGVVELLDEDARRHISRP